MKIGWAGSGTLTARRGCSLSSLHCNSLKHRITTSVEISWRNFSKFYNNIVGLGRVGVEVSRRALAFGMKVIAHDPYVAPSLAQQLNIALGTLDEVFAQSDYITLHVGLTPQTQSMINSESIRKMKKGVRLINCARGELLNDAAVVDALQSGQLGGVALDVYSNEPVKDSPLASLPNVILTPHIAGSTHEAQEAVGVQIALQVREYLLKGVIQNAVNVPSISEEEYQEMRPYIALGERLGAFLAQSNEGGVEEMGLSYSGEIAEWKTALIRNAAVAGALNQIAHAQERANLVNAASIAEERGIRLTERKQTRDAGGAAANVLRMTFKTGQQENTVAGCVQPGGLPRLLEIDGIRVEAPLEGNVVYLRNLDVPGVIGRVGTVLGQHNVNIANFSLGRGRDGQEASAVAVVQVDGESARLFWKPARHRDHSAGQGDSLRCAAAENGFGVTSLPRKTNAALDIDRHGKLSHKSLCSRAWLAAVPQTVSSN